MNARYVLSGIVLALLAVAGCAGSGDTPEAPPPRAQGEKNTTAELLVGTWQAVRVGDIELPPEGFVRIEYTPEGGVISTVSHPKRGTKGKTGTYRLDGNILNHSWNPNPDGFGETQYLIQKVTDQELHVEELPLRQRREPVVYKRVAQRL
jgi:hypothetical protein